MSHFQEVSFTQQTDVLIQTQLVFIKHYSSTTPIFVYGFDTKKGVQKQTLTLLRQLLKVATLI